MKLTMQLIKDVLLVECFYVIIYFLKMMMISDFENWLLNLKIAGV